MTNLLIVSMNFIGGIEQQTLSS